MIKKDTTSKSKKGNSAEDVIEVNKVEQGSAIAAGRNAKAVVINFFGGYWQVTILIAIIALMGSGYFVWRIAFPRPREPPRWLVAARESD